MADDAAVAAMELESALWLVLPLPSESLQENHDDSTELLDDDDDGDYMDVGYYDQLQFDSTHDQIVLGQIHHVMNMLGLLEERAMELDDGIQALIALLGGEEAAHGGGGAVPAAAAVVAGLEKQTFHAAAGDQDQEGCGGGAECTICFEDFKDGEEVSVMPCSGGHEFHTECISKWLGQYSNMCPLCRHALPTSVNGQ
ncbi:hypothetical protein U9M48_034849 [Paspalum notatum var. saurae]|uniref:RING-type domain-containing protein n=1 Tax=Paspalum notatum var. saurae TaxID=547442 RepID=A0AAQ3UDQ7_PASNO